MSGAFGKFEWALAGRYLRARRRDSYISVIAVISLLGIMLGVATLIVVMAVMTGFRADLLDRIVGVNGHARIESRFASRDDMDATVAKLRTIPGVISARPMIDGQIMAAVGNNVRGMVLRGFPVVDLEQLPALQGKVRAGQLGDLTGEATIAIGARLAEIHGLMVGDTLTLISPQGVVTPFGSAPNVENFTIKAIFEIGLSDYDMNIAFTNYDTLATFLARPAQTGVIEFDVTDADDIDRVSGLVREALGEGFGSVATQPWQGR
jgi:lipoprotein-releasing system permease protein